MKKETKLVVALAVAFLCLGSASLAGDFENGHKAFQAGNFSKAFKLWKPMALDGHPQAQYGLGVMHEYGRGLKSSDTEAAKWYLQAAEQGVPDAQYRLGVFYDYGWGLNADPEQAVIWYKQAAERDHTFAQHDLAFMYLDGKGVPADKVQAYKWLRIASTRRADLMAKHLRHVASEMNAEEIVRAEALATRWLQAR